MRKLWLALLLSFALVAAACSSDGDGGDGDGDASADAPELTGEPLDFEAVLATDLDNCEEEPTGDPLVIGYAADFNPELGGFADEPGSMAAEYLAEKINCAGGIDGTPVDVVVEDVQGDPDAAQRATQDLIDAGAAAILGPPFSEQGLPMLQTTDGEVPVLFVASTEEALPDAELNSFLVPFDDAIQSSAAAEFALAEGCETAVTFTSPDAPYFERNPQVFTEVFEEGGGEVVADFTWSLEDEDFSSQVSELAGIDPTPDCLYTAMLMPLIEILLGQLGGAGVEIQVIGSDAFDATNILAAGDLADGAFYVTHGFPGEDTRMRAFLDSYEADRGEALETVSFGTLAGDAVLIVVDAFIRAGALDPAAIGEAIAETEDLELITESVTYAGTNGTPIKPVFVHGVNVGGAPDILTAIDNGDLVLADSFVPQNVPSG